MDASIYTNVCVSFNIVNHNIILPTAHKSIHDNMSAQVVLVSPNFAPLFSYVVRQLTFHKGQASTLIKSRSILGCTSQLNILVCSFVYSVVHFNIDLISTMSRAVTMLCFGELVVHHWTMFLGQLYLLHDAFEQPSKYQRGPAIGGCHIVQG